jgi:hypothetical protein
MSEDLLRDIFVALEGIQDVSFFEKITIDKPLVQNTEIPCTEIIQIPCQSAVHLLFK